MQIFRKLSKNIFFKIILGIVGLSFVTFGISGFISGMPSSWVVKIGGEKIGVRAFEKSLDLDRRVIRSIKGSTPEIENYLSSEKFKSDVLNRLIRKTLIQKVSDKIGAFGSNELILRSVAEDKNFQTADGKFDKNKFSEFLKNNGLDEERYLQEVSNEVSAEMILRSMVLALPVSLKNVVEIEELNQEKRVVDVVNITKNNISNIAAPNDDEINKFHQENKAKYQIKELREASVVEVNLNEIKNDDQATENEIKQYYDDNRKNLFTSQENKNLLHLSFDNEKSAQDFLQKLQSSLDPDKSNLKEQFIKLAKNIQKKSLKDITLEKIVTNSLPKEVGDAIANLKVGELSSVVKTQIGFHIFILNQINPAAEIPLAEVKEKISQQIAESKKQKATQDKIEKINNALMAAKSLDEVANNFNFKIIKLTNPVDIDGNDNEGNINNRLEKYPNFTKNIFTSKKNQPSKLFATVDENKFYAFEVDNIIASRDPELTEIKSKIIADIVEQKKTQALRELVKKIENEIKENPAALVAIANKNGLKIEKSKLMPRTFLINVGSSTMPYKTELNEEIFKVNIGQATKAIEVAQDTFSIAVIRDEKKSKLTSTQVVDAKKKAVEMFANEIMLEYNDYLEKKFPVEINKKFFNQNS